MQFSRVSFLAGLALTVPAVLAQQSSNSVSAADIAALLSNSSLASNSSNIGSSNGNLNLGNGLNLDSNNLQGSLLGNIEQLLVSMGFCNFDSNVLSGFGVNQEFQLMLQLQQLEQLQSLGLISSSSVNQLLQEELLSSNFGQSVNSLNSGNSGNNLNLFGGIKRKVDEVTRVRVLQLRFQYRAELMSHSREPPAGSEVSLSASDSAPLLRPPNSKVWVLLRVVLLQRLARRVLHLLQLIPRHKQLLRLVAIRLITSP
jgi:hypothetical protein